MEGYPWIKLYRDIGDDSKMKRLTSDEFMLWIIMMTKVDSDGFLFLTEGVPYNSEDLSLSCNNFRKSIDDGVSIVETALKKFTSMKMISIKEDGLVCLLNFKARQEKNLTEAERQAKSRENKKNQKQEEPCHTDVTPMSHDSVTHVTEVSQESHPKIEEERRKKKELENTNTPPNPPTGGIVKSVVEEKPKAAVREIFEYWQQELGHPQTLLTGDREAKVRVRLKEGYTIEKIKAGIRGIKLSDYHMGRGKDSNGQVYDDLVHVCKSGTNLDRFIALDEQNRRAEDEAKQRENARIAEEERKRKAHEEEMARWEAERQAGPPVTSISSLIGDISNKFSMKGAA